MANSFFRNFPAYQRYLRQLYVQLLSSQRKKFNDQLSLIIDLVERGEADKATDELFNLKLKLRRALKEAEESLLDELDSTKLVMQQYATFRATVYEGLQDEAQTLGNHEDAAKFEAKRAEASAFFDASIADLDPDAVLSGP